MALAGITFVLLSGGYGVVSYGMKVGVWEFLLIMLGLFIGLLIAVAYLVSGVIHLRNLGDRPRSGVFITAAATVPALYAFILYPALR